MILNLWPPDVLGLQLPEAFTTTSAGQDFWELKSKNIWRPKVGDHWIREQPFLKKKEGLELGPGDRHWMTCLKPGLNPVSPVALATLMLTTCLGCTSAFQTSRLLLHENYLTELPTAANMAPMQVHRFVRDV